MEEKAPGDRRVVCATTYPFRHTNPGINMKTITTIVVLALIGWYGNLLYKQHRLPFIQDSLTYSEMEGELKCITKDGRTIYGKVPEGTICASLTPIKGSLAIVPTAYISPDNNNRRQSSNFECDGRTYCSQMRSCEEATFFLNNCPNTKMDGNNDGIPCERQWCGH